MTKLTAKEAELLNGIMTNEYANGQREAGVQVWTGAVCKTRSRAAVLGSLIKKGLAESCDESCPGEDDACCWLTDAGFEAWCKLYPVAADPVLAAMKKANDDLEAASAAMDAALAATK